MNTTTKFLTLATMLMLPVGCEVPELDVPRDAAAPVQASGTATAQAEPSTNEINRSASQPREATGLDPKKGKLSREQGGYLGSVLGAGMYAQHQAIFLQVKNAINLDYGLNGDFPKSHEEFMERVIKFNKLQLPELDEGDQYLYDPEDHTLKIFRPES